jgi:uncharacterized spore protein YtfJ
MDLDAILAASRDTISIKRVFGDPIERDGMLIIPAAVVLGGGGGGQDGQTDHPGGSGGGFGVWARPIGVYTVRDGRVEFRPAIDLAALALCAAVFVPRLLRARTRRRRG